MKRLAALAIILLAVPAPALAHACTDRAAIDNSAVAFFLSEIEDRCRSTHELTPIGQQAKVMAYRNSGQGNACLDMGTLTGSMMLDKMGGSPCDSAARAAHALAGRAGLPSSGLVKRVGR